MKIGAKITLQRKSDENELEKFTTKIIEMNENYIIIDYPVNQKTKRTEFFAIGTRFLFSFVGEDDAVYEFPTKIVARVKLNVPAIALSRPEEGEMRRIQRREFVRIDATIDIAVHQANGNGFATITSDISGGGVSLIVPKGRVLEIGEEVDLWLALSFQSGKFYYLHVKAEVVFTQEKNGVQTAAVKFLTLNTKEQQLVISFTFEKQREMRKKELS